MALLNHPTDPITSSVIGAAIEVHRQLGPGLLESAYQSALAYELAGRGWMCKREVSVPVGYKGIALDPGYRIDLLVHDTVIVEIKSVEKLLRIHEAQVMTYLRLMGKPVALLINFNVQSLTSGIRRILS